MRSSVRVVLCGVAAVGVALVWAHAFRWLPPSEPATLPRLQHGETDRVAAGSLRPEGGAAVAHSHSGTAPEIRKATGHPAVAGPAAVAPSVRSAHAGRAARRPPGSSANPRPRSSLPTSPAPGPVASAPSGQPGPVAAAPAPPELNPPSTVPSPQGDGGGAGNGAPTPSPESGAGGGSPAGHGSTSQAGGTSGDGGRTTADTPACPDGGKAVSGALVVVSAGSLIATFHIAPGCAGVSVSLLASGVLPAGSPPVQAVARSFDAGGPYSLAIGVPACQFRGDLIAQGQVVASVTGGSACPPATPPITTPPQPQSPPSPPQGPPCGHAGGSSGGGGSNGQQGTGPQSQRDGSSQGNTPNSGGGRHDRDRGDDHGGDGPGGHP